MQTWLASSLSDEQRRPAERDTANACVLAAAGSGKTRVLVSMVADDIASGVSPSGIIAFTFTEKAGEELLTRIHRLVRQHVPDANLEGLFAGTIHSWCFQMLTTQQRFYGVTPLDELHVDALASRLYDELGLEKAYGRPYPKAIDPFLADLELFHNEHLAIEQVPEHIRLCIECFTDVLRENGLLTFGGMIREATELLVQGGPLQRLQRLYVDEYQDVNPAQVELVRAMLPQDGRLVAVGDDLQCIYNWRGSDISRILGFSSEFSDASIHRLRDNYRSRPKIVDVANAIASGIEMRDAEREMIPIRPPHAGSAVAWCSLADVGDEADAVADLVCQFASAGVPLESMAVLLRSVTGSGRPIVEALRDLAVPVRCPVLAGGEEFVAGFLVGLFDWLRTGGKEAHNEIEERDLDERAQLLWNAASRWVSPACTETQYWLAVSKLDDQVEKCDSHSYNIRALLYAFFDACGIRVGEDDQDLAMGLGIATQIVRSVEEVHRRRLPGRQRRSSKGVISEIYFALLRNWGRFGESEPIRGGGQGVLVTTIHQSKGLEWPVVIIPELVRGRFPVRRSGHGTSFPDEIASRYGTTHDDERRLLYVAVTRARERLILLDSVVGSPEARSIFIRDLHEKGVVSPVMLSDMDQSFTRLDAEDVSDNHAAPVRVGLSDLLLYVECPYQYGLRRTAGIQAAVGDELGIGQGLHELIRCRAEAAGSWSKEELDENVTEHVRIPYMSAEGEQRIRRNLASRLRVLEDLGAFDESLSPEVRVDVSFEHGIVSGVVDGVYSQRDGGLVIRDWKANIHDALWPRYERQLQFYALAMRLRGLDVLGAEAIDVAASSKKRGLVTRPALVQEETLFELSAILDRALEGISRCSFPPIPTEAACTCCDVFEVCGERGDDVTPERPRADLGTEAD